jgi:hypothetical protein
LTVLPYSQERAQSNSVLSLSGNKEASPAAPDAEAPNAAAPDDAEVPDVAAPGAVEAVSAASPAYAGRAAPSAIRANGTQNHFTVALFIPTIRPDRGYCLVLRKNYWKYLRILNYKRQLFGISE